MRPCSYPLVAAFAAVAIACPSISSAAETIATCGASAGKSYYPNTKLASRAMTGWTDDKISEGRFTLTQISDKVYDVLFADTTGRVVSSTQDGGRVLLVGKDQDAIAVLVVYPGVSVETYSFYRTNDGKAELAWTQLRFGGTVDKAGVLTAPCDRLVVR
ncbi:MAG: hypothetical protein MUC55_04360 [Burkholderiales bacterium]|jgi:hypothetical protein|nr:hypothetical protein [Burkholderiales bacterium]